MLERINDNAYKIDLPGEYQVSATFNVADLSPFDNAGADSRMNPFEEGGNDTNNLGKEFPHHDEQQDKLSLPSGPITRQQASRLKQAMQGFVQGLIQINIQDKAKTNKEEEPKEPKLVILLKEARDEASA